jgi:hypothetical protein
MMLLVNVELLAGVWADCGQGRSRAMDGAATCGGQAAVFIPLSWENRVFGFLAV